jgi:nucleoside-diphosphate-sugar epimerase
LILGLGERKKASGKDVHFIQVSIPSSLDTACDLLTESLETSGTSNVGDLPITGKYHESHVFSDHENIYAYEKSREALQIYPQRTTDIAVVETGLAAGVKTTIIMSPTIYGFGTGLFNKLSIQIPALLRAAIKAGQVKMIGEGKGQWDYVHVTDLAKLYEILLVKILKGEEIPTGEKGILFSGTGRYSWAEL